MSDPNLTDAEKVLMYIISDHYQYCMNFGKESKMSYSVLRQRTGWWNDKIQKHIESLREKKLISVETHKVKGNQNTPMVFTSTLVGYSENHNTYSENRNTYSENRNTNEVKSEYECSENRNTSVPKIGKNNNSLQYNQHLSNGEEGCSFPEKNQKLVGNKYNSHCLQDDNELNEASKDFLELLNKQQ